MKRRLLCVLLALMLCVGLLPMAALATSEEPDAAEAPVVADGEVAAEEVAPEEATEEADVQAVSFDGDAAGYVAVTGDAVIENGMIELYGLFTKPETETYCRCLLRLYEAGWTEGFDVYAESMTWALNGEKIGGTWALDGAYGFILPGVTYYFYAVIEDAEGNVVATGEVKSFEAPVDEVEPIQIGQTITIPEGGTIARYSFTPTGDGVYALKLNNGYASVSVYDSAGETKAMVWRDVEMPDFSIDRDTFTAESGQTYYIEAVRTGSAASSFTVEKEGDVTAFKAVTGDVAIEGDQVTIDGTFTKPATVEHYGCMILLGLSEADVAANKITGSAQIGFDNKQWSGKTDSKEVTASNLLIPGVTYYYCAAIQNNGEWDIIARGDIKSFKAPESDFETLQENTIQKQDAFVADYSFTADGGSYELKIDAGEGYAEVYDSNGVNVAFVYCDGGWKSEAEYGTFTARAGETYYVRVRNYLETAIRFSVNCTAPAHSWDDGVVTTEPTCTEKGVKTYTCSECGETKTEDVAALGHTWDDGVVTTEPTCTEKGVKTYACSECGETKTEDVAALDHDWTAWEQTAAPTCTEKGEEMRTCKRECGVEPETREIDALGHGEWEDDYTVIMEATCGENGLAEGTCGRCGEKIEEIVLPATGDHTWDEGKVTKEATTTAEGEKTYTCAVCGATKTEAIAKLPTSSGGTGAAQSPKTGDESNLIVWAAILVVACGGAVVLTRRKKEN